MWLHSLLSFYHVPHEFVKFAKQSQYKFFIENDITFFERNKYKLELLKQIPPLSYLEIYYNSRLKFLCTIFTNQCERDMVQFEYSFIHKHILHIENEEDLKSRFEDNYDEVNLRMFFRLELFCHGWTVKQIETYINKKFYQFSLLEENDFDENYQEIMMHNLCILLEKQVMVNEWKGRPSLPPSLKTFNLETHKTKIKDKMKHLYSCQNSFLTKEELEMLLQCIPNKDQEPYKTILTKLQKFTIP